MSMPRILRLPCNGSSVLLYLNSYQFFDLNLFSNFYISKVYEKTSSLLNKLIWKSSLRVFWKCLIEYCKLFEIIKYRTETENRYVCDHRFDSQVGPNVSVICIYLFYSLGAFNVYYVFVKGVVYYMSENIFCLKLFSLSTDMTMIKGNFITFSFESSSNKLLFACNDLMMWRVFYTNIASGIGIITRCLIGLDINLCILCTMELVWW